MRRNSLRTDRLLVIGAGPVGLAMADALKQRGLAFDIVDASDGVGGLWRHGVYQGVHIVSSKTSTAYTHYPMPAHYPDFPSSTQMLRYLENFAHDRDLDPHIEVRRKVERAFPLADESWQVRFDDGEERTYRGIVVCNGHHWDRRMPRYPGRFTGSFIHSADYREPKQLQGQRVLVIGGGNSGCDIACEAARVGASCDWSLRSGYWFLPKTAFGRPLTDLPIWNLPVFMQRPILRALIAAFIGDYRRYGLQKPDHKLFERHPAFGTDVLNYLRQGRIRPRADIARFSGTRVHFTDGSVGEYDLVVAATGFNNAIPFLPKGLVSIVNNVPQLYGGAFSDLVKNIYVVGAAQPRNGFGSLVTPAAKLFAELIEMQAEMELPIGYVLKEQGMKLPTTPLIDPGAARREIRLANWTLWMFRKQAQRMAEKKPRPPFDPSLYEFEGNEGGPVAVNQ